MSLQFLTILNLIKLMFVSCVCALGSLLCVWSFVDVSLIFQRKRDCNCVSSSPIAKWTRLSSQSSKDSNRERFKTPLDSQTHSSIFEDATSIVEWVVRFDTLGTTFIPRIFEAKDWANLFENFKDPMEELVREFFSNARYIGVKLKCWVRGKEFSINPNYIAKVLYITRPEDMDLTPYND